MFISQRKSKSKHTQFLVQESRSDPIFNSQLTKLTLSSHRTNLYYRTQGSQPDPNTSERETQTATADQIRLASESDMNEDKAEIERLVKLIVKSRASKKRVIHCKEKLAVFITKQANEIGARHVVTVLKVKTEVQNEL